MRQVPSSKENAAEERQIEGILERRANVVANALESAPIRAEPDKPKVGGKFCRGKYPLVSNCRLPMLQQEAE